LLVNLLINILWQENISACLPFSAQAEIILSIRHTVLTRKF
jgi:hypothetical protein